MIYREKSKKILRWKECEAVQIIFFSSGPVLKTMEIMSFMSSRLIFSNNQPHRH